MRSADIARIIHPFETGEPAHRRPDRRQYPRWSYPVTQLVAFHEKDQQATKEMLKAVRCHDIAMGGISFFLPSPPPSEYCTVVLGRPPAMICVTAKVLHSAQVNGASGEWKVGCEFIDKVDSLVAPRITGLLAD